MVLSIVLFYSSSLVRTEKRVSGDLKLLVIQKLLGERRLAKQKFSAQFSRVEQLLKLYRTAATAIQVQQLLQLYRYNS